MTDKYKDEWKANSDWLRLSFHANANAPNRPYAHVSYEQMYFEAERVHKEILRFAGEEAFAQGGDAVVFHELVAAGAHADRIDHEGEVLAVKDIGKGVDDARIEEHAGLRTMDGETVEHSAELERGKFRLGSMDARNSKAVLGGEGRDDTHAESAHGGHGLEVGLDAGTTAGIRTSNGEYIRRLKHRTFLFL